MDESLDIYGHSRPIEQMSKAEVRAASARMARSDAIMRLLQQPKSFAAFECPAYWLETPEDKDGRTVCPKSGVDAGRPVGLSSISELLVPDPYQTHSPMPPPLPVLEQIQVRIRSHSLGSVLLDDGCLHSRFDIREGQVDGIRHRPQC